MTQSGFVILILAIALSACSPREAESRKTQASSTPVKSRKCPDPDNRDRNDPCSVAYIKRTPSRFSEDALK